MAVRGADKCLTLVHLQITLQVVLILRIVFIHCLFISSDPIIENNSVLAKLKSLFKAPELAVAVA